MLKHLLPVVLLEHLCDVLVVDVVLAAHYLLEDLLRDHAEVLLVEGLEDLHQRLLVRLRLLLQRHQLQELVERHREVGLVHRHRRRQVAGLLLWED